MICYLSKFSTERCPVSVENRPQIPVNEGFFFLEEISTNYVTMQQPQSQQAARVATLRETLQESNNLHRKQKLDFVRELHGGWAHSWQQATAQPRVISSD